MGGCGSRPTSNGWRSTRTRVHEAAATSAAGEVERARRALGGRGGGAARDPAGVRRAAAFLARRGFDTETVAAVLDLDVDC